MSEQEKIPAELWEPLEEQQKDAEKMERPSLTFFQDGWRRLRSNKLAIISLFCIVLIGLAAIVVPWFWEYSYDEQDLTMANLPITMKVYPLTEDTSIYVTPQFSVIELEPDGHLRQLNDPVRKDLMGKKNYHTVDGHDIVVDFGVYSRAAAEYKKLEKSVEGPGDDVSVADAEYLQKYFADDPDKTTVSLMEAKNILENKIDRVEVQDNGQILTETEKVHNKTYLLGTDSLGRDMLIRLIYGARISLTVGIFAALINFIVGVFYGGIAGYVGGRVDDIMMRIIDIISSIPTTLYVILIMVVVGPGLISIILALGLTSWLKMARIVRGQVLTLKSQEFVKAAIVTGADTKRIMVKHLIPNMMGPIMVNIAMQIPSAIFEEAFLSFVGLGISAPMASWGTLCNDALAGIYVYPYQMILPAIAISVTILTFNLFSDGLRDAFDPKLRK